MNVCTNLEQPGSAKGTRWYDLFSRGARDWLRHNEKVRETVREKLPELISQANIVEHDGNRRVQVPVKFLEHYRFKLNEDGEHGGVGQGKANPGDVLRKAQRPSRSPDKGPGGNEGGGVEFVLELTVDDIVEWLWQELELPNLQQKTGSMEHDEYQREGWNRRGARSRLDRRRSLKESIKRRSIQKDGPAVTDDDLRFRQLVLRDRPAYKAVVFFVMDVSASMTQRDRQIAKTFFFWVVQGLRRQYNQLDCEFIAHTDKAWRFEEHEFFELKGTGGTVASTAFDVVLERIADQYSPAGYNIYLFYASDGDNFSQDRAPATEKLGQIADVANYGGFVETVTGGSSKQDAEMAKIFEDIKAHTPTIGIYYLRRETGIWDAIKAFFQQSAAAE